MAIVQRTWDPERYIDTQALARMLGISDRTLWRRIRQGVLPPPTHPGRPNYFEFDTLLAHVERTDPWLSCQVAGGIGRLRGYWAQSRRLRTLLNRSR